MIVVVLIPDFPIPLQLHRFQQIQIIVPVPFSPSDTPDLLQAAVLVAFTTSQARNIMKQYVQYYNELRPHQGIDNNVPNGSRASPKGTIRRTPVLFGLCTNYFREAS